MKPSILFIYVPKRDIPLFTQFYEYVSRPDSPLDARVHNKNVGLHISKMVEAKFGGVPPHFIFKGFPGGIAIKKSADYIRKNDIKIILEFGDIAFTSTPAYMELAVGDVEVDYIVVRRRKTEGHKHEKLLRRFMKKKKQLRRTEIIYVPWGINPEIYNGASLNRDIDVSMLGRWYHKRVLARDALLRLREKGFNIVLSKFPLPSVETFWNKYLNLLLRSKIFLTIGRKLHQVDLVQKYLEGAASGAMLLGDIPYTGKDVFEDGVSIVEITDEQGRPLKGYESVDRQIQYYLEHDEERNRIALEGRRRVLETFSLDKVTKEFEKVLISNV